MVLIAALVCPVSVLTSLAHHAYSVEAGRGLGAGVCSKAWGPGISRVP